MGQGRGVSMDSGQYCGKERGESASSWPPYDLFHLIHESISGIKYIFSSAQGRSYSFPVWNKLGLIFPILPVHLKLWRIVKEKCYDAACILT